MLKTYITIVSLLGGGEISAVIGRKLFMQTLITDDARAATGSGGVQTIVLGSFGTGKSTLLGNMAQFSRFMTKGSKQSYIHHVVHKLPLKGFETKPTTVLWRARDLDLWPALIPTNWLERIQGFTPKPLHVFVHNDDYDDITLFCYNDKEDYTPHPIPNLPKIEQFSKADDLIPRLVDGAINVVVEPQSYRISSRLSMTIQEMRSDFIGKENRDEKKDNAPERRGKGRPRRISNYEQHAVKPAVFWFDAVSAAMSLWRGKPLQVILDEGDDLLTSKSADVMWWAQGFFVEAYRDFRKANLSTVISTHTWDMIRDELLKRSTHKILFPGIKKSQNSMIRQAPIINRLQPGNFIIENTNREFGREKFGRIPNPIVCKIDGLKGAYPSLTPKQAREIREIYLGTWGEGQATLKECDEGKPATDETKEFLSYFKDMVNSPAMGSKVSDGT
jgi:hypothetical protein